MRIILSDISILNELLNRFGSLVFVPTERRISGNIIRNWSEETLKKHLLSGNIAYDDDFYPPFVIFKGKKFSKRSDGYFLCTTGEREYLHRAIWEDRYGKIPDGFDVYHMDGVKTNNDPENLNIMSNRSLVRTRNLWKRFNELKADLDESLGRH